MWQAEKALLSDRPKAVTPKTWLGSSWRFTCEQISVQRGHTFDSPTSLSTACACTARCRDQVFLFYTASVSTLPGDRSNRVRADAQLQNFCTDECGRSIV